MVKTKAIIRSIKLPVAVNINETGGYAGVNRIWKVYKENEKYPRNALNVRTYDGWELTDWITIDMTKELTSYWHKNPGYEK